MSGRKKDCIAITRKKTFEIALKNRKNTEIAILKWLRAFDIWKLLYKHFIPTVNFQKLELFSSIRNFVEKTTWCQLSRHHTINHKTSKCNFVDILTKKGPNDVEFNCD